MEEKCNTSLQNGSVQMVNVILLSGSKASQGLMVKIARGLYTLHAKQTLQLYVKL